MASSIKPISVTFAAGSDPFVTAILRLAVASGRFTSPHGLDDLIAVRDSGRRDRGSRLRAGEEASALAGDPEQISIGTFDQDIAAEAETTGLPHSANSSHAQAQASVFEPGHP